MSILVPKSHKDGSQLGMHKREWSNILSDQIYSSASIINGAAITSGSTSLLVDGRPLIISPFTETSISSELTPGIIGLRLNNLMKPTASYNMNGKTLANVRTPTSDGEVATKYYVDQNIQGLKWKQSTRIASHLTDVTSDYWNEKNGTLLFVETAADSNEYALVSGGAGWVYDNVNETLKWGYPYSYSYQRHPDSNPSIPAPTGGSGLNSGNGYLPMNINYSYPSNTNYTSYTSANIGDIAKPNEGNYGLSDFTINFRKTMFDGGPNDTAYGDIEIGDRVLIKNATPAHINGIWYFEQTGSNLDYSTTISHPEHKWNWSLKRALDFDHSSEVSSAAVFVEEGHISSDKSYVVTTNTSSIAAQDIGTYDVHWSIFGTQIGDDITIYKDETQNNRFEVTGVLRDINDIYYNYAALPLGERLPVLDGEFLVGDGTTFVAESGNTVRTSMGLGTGSNVIFTNLHLLGGALTASHLVSNNSSNPLVFDSDISGTINITARNVTLDETLDAKNITARNSLTVQGNAQIDGSLNSNNNITAGKSISAQFVTASVVMSASYIQLKEFNNASEFSNANPTQNSLYVANNALYFDGNPIGGSGGGGQPIENVLYYGGNIVSDIDAGTGYSDSSIDDFYMRIGVSGSHQSTITDAAGRASYYQILTGSFQELTGTKVAINGGTIDGTIIGGSSAAAGTFSTLTATNANIATAQIDAGNLTGSVGVFTKLTGSNVDINGGTIDGTAIGNEDKSTGKFTELTGSTHLYTPLADIGRILVNSSGLSGTPGLIGNTIIGRNPNGSLGAREGMFTQLTASQGIESSGVSTLNGINPAHSTISNFTIDSSCQVEISNLTLNTARYDNVYVTNLQMPKDDTVTVGNQRFKLYADHHTILSEIDYRTNSAGLRINATTITGSKAYFDNIEVKAGEVTASYGNFTSLTGSKALLEEVDINSGSLDNIAIGDLAGSYNTGRFDILTGSFAEFGYVDINSGSLDNIRIGEDSNEEVYGRFDILSGSNAQIGEPGNDYISYGKFLTLSASHAEIIDDWSDPNGVGGYPNAQNRGEFKHLTGSAVAIKGELSVDPTSLVNFNGNVIANIGTPDTSSAHRNSAVNRAYIDTVVAIKTSVRVAQTTHISPINDHLQAEDPIDGIQLEAGDRVLLVGQNDPKENGIWEVTGPGAPIRPFDYMTDDPVGEFIVYVKEGNNNKKSIFSITRPDGTSTGIIDTDPVVVTKISSHFGVSTAGMGLKKINSLFSVNIATGSIDETAFEDRSNLTFDTRPGATEPRLALSSSIRVNALKVIDESGSTGEVFISGSANSRIDNVQIGMRQPADAQFAKLTLSGGSADKEFILDSGYKISSATSSTNTLISLHKGEFEEIHVPGSFVADNNDPSLEKRVIISGSLIMANEEPNDTTQRIYVKDGDLFYENHKIGHGGGTTPGNTTLINEFTSIFVTGSQADGHGAFISGSLVVEGDVHVKGTTTTISSSNTTFQDSILGLGITGSDAGTEEFNNIGDRGLIFARGPSSSAALPGLWWDGSKFNFAKSTTSPSSGSFGTITERSKVNTGDVEATSVTASLGLRVGNTTDGYNLPLTSGNENQFIKQGSGGQLIFSDITENSSNFLVKKIIVSGDPGNNFFNIQQVSLGNKSPNIIFLDFSNRDTTSSAYLPAAGNHSYYTVRLTNIDSSLFIQPEREFYLGISGFDHDHYAKNAERETGLGIRIVIDPNQAGGIRRSSATSNGSISHFGSDYSTWTTIQRNFNIQSPNTLDTELAMAFGHDFQFTAGEKADDAGGSQLLERCVTDSNKIFCFKFTWINDDPNAGQKLVVNYDNIEIFSVNDSRFNYL